ncbi:MAG: hypothetical protein GY759_01545 [Chloroflexi bacterium]|nr:hypothetical protein [Chloroflexota bacterium]
MVDWIIVSSWLIEGMIVACFVIAGYYIATRLFGKKPDTSQQIEDTVDRQAFTEADTVPVQTIPQTELPTLSIQQALTAPLESDLSAGYPPVRYAFDFKEDDQLTIVLEMPVSMLEHDSDLAEVWVDTIGKAQIERQNMYRGGQHSPGLSPAPESVYGNTESNRTDDLHDQLDAVLNRLQHAATRRQDLRTSLSESFAEPEQER